MASKNKVMGKHTRQILTKRKHVGHLDICMKKKMKLGKDTMKLDQYITPNKIITSKSIIDLKVRADTLRRKHRSKSSHPSVRP